MNTKIEKLEKRLNDLEERIEVLQQNTPEDQLSMVVFSGDLDRLLASFIIATGASAMFERVVMFFTFWGIPALRDPAKHVEKAELLAKAFGQMLPSGAEAVKTFPDEHGRSGYKNDTAPDAKKRRYVPAGSHENGS